MPWLRLMRLPTVFTALTNILCGYFVSTDSRALPDVFGQTEFWLLLVSSALLYLGGMVLNDVFDYELDCQERPKRFAMNHWRCLLTAGCPKRRPVCWKSGFAVARGGRLRTVNLPVCLDLHSRKRIAVSGVYSPSGSRRSRT